MSVIQAYNAKAFSILGNRKIGKPLWPIYYGTELEYEVKTPSAYKTREQMHSHRADVGQKLQKSIKEFAFTKHDGSLKNGFEVVTLPMSLDAHHKYWNEFFNIAKNTGIEVKATCGMHVHASREILTPFQIGKMLVFIFSPENNEFICQLGGRKPPQQYAEMNPKKVGDVHKHANRYSALNLTNPETVEFRFFKGTLSKEHTLKNIEFCDALVRFTWPGQCGFQDLKKQGVPLFSSFVDERKDDYPYLYKYLCKTGYIKGPAKKRGRVKVARNAKKKNLGESSLIGFLDLLGCPKAEDYSFAEEE